MKRWMVLFLACLAVLISHRAFADSYDAQWIAQCVDDNKDANVSVEVITRYCTCMNNKMSRDESRSITEWEKTHPRERAECDREAGWK
jgi:hypothetical protein